MATSAISLVITAMVGVAGAQQPLDEETAVKADFGKREFDAKCAACHGADGKGNGPQAAVNKTAVPDLTKLTEANGGMFPFERVYKIIDGTQLPKGHDAREMPVWGEAFKFRPENSAYIVLELTNYLYRLQRK